MFRNVSAGCVALLLMAGMASAQAVIGFESPGYKAGVLGSQDSWKKVSGGDYQVISSGALAGNQSLEFSGAVRSRVARPLKATWAGDKAVFSILVQPHTATTTMIALNKVEKGPAIIQVGFTGFGKAYQAYARGAEQKLTPIEAAIELDKVYRLTAEVDMGSGQYTVTLAEVVDGKDQELGEVSSTLVTAVTAADVSDTWVMIDAVATDKRPATVRVDEISLKGGEAQ